jgi:hypothetical protein
VRKETWRVGSCLDAGMSEEKGIERQVGCIHHGYAGGKQDESEGGGC